MGAEPLIHLPDLGQCSWIAGEVEVPVAGQHHYLPGIAAALAQVPPGWQMVAVLAPEPTNPHDRHAVAVYLQNQLVGHLPATIAEPVKYALTRHSAAHGGRPVACAAIIQQDRDSAPHVVLLLDVAALGLRVRDEQPEPDLAVTLSRLLRLLNAPPPPPPPPALTGTCQPARDLLAATEENARAVEEDQNRPRGARAKLARQFEKLVDDLTDADDPMVGRAWLGLAWQLQYLPGQRDECLGAYVRAIHHNRGYIEAWQRLVSYSARAPHVPTLLDLAARMPIQVRHQVLKTLLSISHGSDQHGLMSADDGQHLRDGLVELARSQGDVRAERKIMTG